MARTRYRFVDRVVIDGIDMYLWESVLPVGPRESRHEQVRCPVGWFWGAS